MMGFYEEIKSLHSSLDLYKNGRSCIDRKQFLCLNGGTPWARNFKNSGYVHMERTAFNHSGCMQPLLLADMLDRDDPDGFNDRYLISVPKEVTFLSHEYKVLMDEQFRDMLYKIYVKVGEEHAEGQHIQYKLSPDAVESFWDYHDNHFAPEKTKVSHDDNRRGVLSKSLGYALRLAGVIHIMNQAATAIQGDEDDEVREQWDTNISLPTLKKAICLVKYFTAMKFAMLPPVEAVDLEGDQLATKTTGKSELNTRKAQKIRKLLEFCPEGEVIDASTASRNALLPAVQKENRTTAGSRYPTWAAEEFFLEVSKLGFGSVLTQGTANKQQKKAFRKRHLDDLSDPPKKVLRLLGLSEAEYKVGKKNLITSESTSTQESHHVTRPENNAGMQASTSAVTSAVMD